MKTTNRLDPFHDYVWSRGSFAQIRSRRKMVARVNAGLRRPPSWFIPTDAEVEAAKQRLHTKRRDQKLGVLAVLDMWRSLTIQQAAAFLGMPELIDHEATIIRDLYALDLVDVGSFEGFSDLEVRTRDVGEWLIRPTRSARYQELVEPHLTYPESVKMTGGMEFMTGGQYDRHNVLATELALRVAEHTPTAMVLGEKWSSHAGLLYEGWGNPDPHPHVNGRGDLTIVRSDGLRIVVEMTASLGRSFHAKVDRWAQRLSSGTLETQGTVVLFVTAGEQHPISHDKKELHSQARAAVLAAVRVHPGLSSSSRTAERMFVARWDELFPARHEASPGFQLLQAASPVGVYQEGADELWTPRSVLDPNDVVYRPTTGLDPLAIIDNGSALLGTPWWFRDGSAPQVAMDAVKQMWPKGLPGVRPEDMAARGTAGRVTFPKRVLL